MLYYYVDKDFSKALGIDDNLDRFVIDHFYEPINNNKDWIIIVSLLIRWDWQTRDKIYW